jgi:hypothetical protein
MVDLLGGLGFCMLWLGLFLELLWLGLLLRLRNAMAKVKMSVAIADEVGVLLSRHDVVIRAFRVSRA